MPTIRADLEARAAEHALDLAALLRGQLAARDRLGRALGRQALAQALDLVEHGVDVDRARVERQLLAVEVALAGLLDALDRGERIEPDLGEPVLLGLARLVGELLDGVLARLEVLPAEVDEEVVARGDDPARELRWSSPENAIFQSKLGILSGPLLRSGPSIVSFSSSPTEAGALSQRILKAMATWALSSGLALAMVFFALCSGSSEPPQADAASAVTRMSRARRVRFMVRRVAQGSRFQQGPGPVPRPS